MKAVQLRKTAGSKYVYVVPVGGFTNVASFFLCWVDLLKVVSEPVAGGDIINVCIELNF